METVQEDTRNDTVRPLLKVDEAEVRGHLHEVVRETVEQTLNQLLDAEVSWGASKGFSRISGEPTRYHGGCPSLTGAGPRTGSRLWTLHFFRNSFRTIRAS